MKKLLIIMLALVLAFVATSAAFSESLGPPGDIVAFAAPVDYTVAVAEKVTNGITLAGYDLALRAALDAIAATIAAFACLIHNGQRARGEHLPSGVIGYHARDQTLIQV